ncbi:hypothetical protein B0H11DRAFT_1995926 [Mycena galericulata]|nr:hypothetical protein B0H11DRAFT_1995926 [Mycena galericulata]
MALVEDAIPSQTTMPRQNWNGEHQIWRGHNFMLPPSPPPRPPNPPYSVDHLPVAPHLLQPPPAPRLRNVPLPGDLTAFHSRSLRQPIPRDIYPIDLTHRINFAVLGRSVASCSIPPYTTVYVFSTSRSISLLWINTEDRPETTFSVIRRLQALIRAPLSLQGYLTDLPPTIQRSVREHFLSRRGHSGPGLWQGFLNGSHHRRGPSGRDLLRGHSFMWGFSQDHAGRWVLYVDLPLST